MDCHKCSNWKCEILTYEELVDRWENSIEGRITPGHLKRYERKAVRLEVELEDLKIGYKYCSKGVLTRFYLMRNERDSKTIKKMKQCSMFSTNNGEMEATVCSPIWQICTVESHGLSEVKGVHFTPGHELFLRSAFHAPVFHRQADDMHLFWSDIFHRRRAIVDELEMKKIISFFAWVSGPPPVFWLHL